MVFTDDLAYQLFTLSFAAFLILYTVLSMYLAYRKKNKNLFECIKGVIVPLVVLGLYMLVLGIWGQFTWPLPGSYNILFYDPFVSFGILLIAFALAVKYNSKLEYVGLLGLLMGVVTVIYGISGYNLGLTEAPIALLGLYLLYGFAGIFSFPVLLMADRLSSQKKLKVTWQITILIFCIFLLLGGLLAGYIATLAIPVHLSSPP